ncbi:DUF7344 domain-containing protein [Halorientalis halophila]|uniref:DUF7344 domain-containing protein n=1 Tax=Halorientalis halophila TaxID=3108499 RepID=UPI00300A3A2B
MAQTTEAVTKTFTSLSDPLRRYVLYYLDEEAPVSIDRLATRVAAWHTDSTPEAVDEDTVTEMRAALYHMHLPKLEQYGYIERKKDAREVAKGPRFEETRPLLEWVDDHAEVADQSDYSFA